MKKADIEATSRVVEKLFSVQDKFGLTDKQMLVGIVSWLVEVGLKGEAEWTGTEWTGSATHATGRQRMDPDGTRTKT